MSWLVEGIKQRLPKRKPKEAEYNKGLKDIGVTNIQLDDRGKRTTFKENFEIAREEAGGILDPDPLVNIEAVPSGTAYDSERFGAGYWGWRGLDTINRKVLNIIKVKSAGNMELYKILLVEYAPILGEIYEDGLRMEALSWKEKHDPASMVATVQTTPPLFPNPTKDVGKTTKEVDEVEDNSDRREET